MNTVKYPALQRRRAELRAAHLCVNFYPGPRAKLVHGPVVSAGRCQSCLDTKKRNVGASTVECPSCRVPANRPCRALGGAGGFTKFHQARIDAAKKGNRQ